jgi:hypothetical protein
MKKTQSTMARMRKYSAVTLLSSGLALQFGGCIPSEFTAVQTTTVTLDGRTVITSLINSAIIAPLQAAIADAVNGYFDSLFDEDSN